MRKQSQKTNQLHILGVRIDTVARSTLEDQLRLCLLSPRRHQVVTVNPEIVMWAQHDGKFRELVNSSSLCVADGFGLAMVARLRDQPVTRITGVELTLMLMKLAQEEHASVFFLGGRDLTTHQAALNIKKRFPGVRIAGAEAGPRISISHDEIRYDGEEQQLLVDHIKLLKPDILLVGFGHPKQEKWIAETLTDLPSVRIAVGLGGVFDYLSGRVARAPAALRALGLEWLFRLARQPWRFPRIYTATVRFLLAVLKERRDPRVR